jgi:spermidine synthase
MIIRGAIPIGLLLGVAAYVASPAAERVLYEKASPYNAIVVTENDEGLRTLWFEPGGARQSVVKVGDPDHLELPYARAMAVGLVLGERPRRVLIVGLGGGTIPGFLHKHFPQTVVDVVDIDPDVVAVAKKYFGFREDATLRAHVADGRRFVATHPNRYDLIFLDAFGADNIPYHLATREFLDAVHRALTPRGIVLANVWSSYSNHLYDSMVRTYQDVFEDLYIVDVRGAGNKILIALPRAQRIARDDLTRRAAQFSTQNRLQFDLGECVRYGFRLPGTDGAQGQILHDKPSRQPAAVPAG